MSMKVGFLTLATVSFSIIPMIHGVEIGAYIDFVEFQRKDYKRIDDG